MSKKKTTKKTTAKKKAPTKKAPAKKKPTLRDPAVDLRPSYTAMCPCGKLLCVRPAEPPTDKVGTKIGYTVDRCPKCRRLNRLVRSPFNDGCERCKQDYPREPQEEIQNFQSSGEPKDDMESWELRKMTCGNCGRKLT